MVVVVLTSLIVRRWLLTADNLREVRNAPTVYLVYGDRDDAIAPVVTSPSDVVEMICTIADDGSFLMRQCTASRAGSAVALASTAEAGA